MNNYIEYFNNYIYKNYDMNNSLINIKYYHSIRVARLMALLAKKMNMSDEDILLAFKLGLCHDLGRFYEVVRNGKFNNLKFDHGTYSNKILYNDRFINYMDVSEHLLFRKAIYNHNKKDITNDLNYREELFTKMLRDIDKIDILRIMVNSRVFEFNKKPSENILNKYFNNISIDIKDITNKSDSVVFYLSFFKDLNFEISKDMVYECKDIDNFINVVSVSQDNEKIFDKVKSKIIRKEGKLC